MSEWLGLVATVIGDVLGGLSRAWRRRSPDIIVGPYHSGGGCDVRIVNLGDQPLYVRSVLVDVLDNTSAEIQIHEAVAGDGGLLSCSLPVEVLEAIVVTNDVAVRVRYKSIQFAERETEAVIFNLVGTEGHIVKVTDHGHFTSFGRCPRCKAEFGFGTNGIQSGKALRKRRKAFERDLRRLCPSHDMPHLRTWYLEGHA